MRNPLDIQGTREERVAQFKNDAELMDVATKLVSEVIEKAKIEAMRRRKSVPVHTAAAEHPEYPVTAEGSPSKRVRWHRRARGFFVRVLAILCFRVRPAASDT